MSMTFSVPDEFREQYKAFAEECGLSQVELLKTSYALMRDYHALEIARERASRPDSEFIEFDELEKRVYAHHVQS